MPEPDGTWVYGVALQPDGKVRIVIGGSFQTVGDEARSRLARLDADGSLDGTFDPGADGTVPAVLVDPDKRILVGGQFTRLGGGGSGIAIRRGLGRLAANPARRSTGDFDGDGRTDLTVFRPSDAVWYHRLSGFEDPLGVQWGNGSDRPVAGDYLG